MAVSKTIFAAAASHVLVAKPCIEPAPSLRRHFASARDTPAAVPGAAATPPVSGPADSSVEAVATWAEQLFIAKGLGGEDAGILRKQKVTGEVLFTLTKEELMAVGMSLGAAQTLMTAIEQLRLLTPIRVAVDPEQLKFIRSPSLEQIYLPPNPAREFWYHGPVDFRRHYAVPGFLRADEVSRAAMEELIRSSEYFVLHEQRQSGKTSYLLELRDHLNAQGEYAVLCLTIEQAEIARDDVAFGMGVMIDELAAQCRITFGTDFEVCERVAQQNPGSKLRRALEYLSWTLHRQQKKFVLLIDEIDSLTGDTLLSTLRQLRGGYHERSNALFPYALMLVGARAVIDYRVYSDEEHNEKVTSGSPFNIASSLRLARFTSAHVTALVKQHNATHPRQQFDESAIAELMNVTDGQPWCVNRLCAEAVTTVTDRTIKAADIRAAMDVVILRHETHLRQLAGVLSEARVRRLLPQLLSDGALDPADDDARYLAELGLLKEVNGQLTYSNKIYAQVIPRVIVAHHSKLLPQINRLDYLNADGSIKMDKLVEKFASHHRASFAIRKAEVIEDVLHTLLYYWLQRLVNSHGRIHREHMINGNAVDIHIEMPYTDAKGQRQLQHELIEVKTFRKSSGKEDTFMAKAKKQVVKYAIPMGLKHCYLLVWNQEIVKRRMEEAMQKDAQDAQDAQDAEDVKKKHKKKRKSNTPLIPELSALEEKAAMERARLELIAAEEVFKWQTEIILGVTVHTAVFV